MAKVHLVPRCTHDDMLGLLVSLSSSTRSEGLQLVVTHLQDTTLHLKLATVVNQVMEAIVYQQTFHLILGGSKCDSHAQNRMHRVRVQLGPNCAMP